MKKPTTTAIRKGAACVRNVFRRLEREGRSATRYQMRDAMKAQGINGNAENFDRTARPVVTPNMALFSRVGRSSQYRAARNEAPTMAVRAISVVARPACARTGGKNVKHRTANAALGSPKYLFAHRYTTK